jgi:hypothetical protein
MKNLLKSGFNMKSFSLLKKQSIYYAICCKIGNLIWFNTVGKCNKNFFKEPTEQKTGLTLFFQDCESNLSVQHSSDSFDIPLFHFCNFFRSHSCCHLLHTRNWLDLPGKAIFNSKTFLYLIVSLTLTIR